jgi:hypothetical protein
LFVAGINLSSSDRKLLEAAVSQPIQNMLYTVSNTEDLDRIGDNFINFVCDGK